MVAEGYKFAAAPLALGLLVLAGSKYLSAGPWPLWVAGVLIFLGLFILYFFRDPERTAPDDPAAVVSPADGRIVEVLDEPLDGVAGSRISIFLSVWDVHVNRAPVAGTILAVDYRPGRFHGALFARASTENEMNVIRMATPRGEMVFKQIAGWIARRVMCWKSPGDTVRAGERIGMIRFGSRVDVWLPREAAVTVRRGDKVRGGSSVLAQWK
jgi:phosphatidylserine decarboxylase